MGGISSGKARHRSKETRDIARKVLDAKFFPKGKLSESLRSIGIDTSKPMQLRQAICAVMGGMALSGNIKAASFIFDLAEETNNSKFTAARRLAFEKMAENADNIEVNESDGAPSVEMMEEIRKQAEELGVYVNAD